MTGQAQTDSLLRSAARGERYTGHCIEIAAPPAEVWREIADFDHWESWNPLYVKSSGSFAVGNTLAFSVALPGMAPQQGTAQVFELDLGERVRYGMRSLGGLLRTTRYIEIHPAGPGRSTLVNGESMAGLLAPLFLLVFGDRVRRGLQGMNEALRARLEVAA